MRVVVAHTAFLLTIREMFPQAELANPFTGDFPEADLLIFTGGEDLNPKLYGEEAEPSVYFSDRRDAWERLVFEHYYGKVKMLGICRGHQFLNVMLGGSLIQDIRVHHPGYHRLSWEVPAPEELNLVNSMHHQAIKAIGDKLPHKVLATHEGIIEAISWGSIVGVQFHPELFSRMEKRQVAFDYLLSLLEGGI